MISFWYYFSVNRKENVFVETYLKLWTCINQKVEKIRAAATIRTLVSH